MRDYKCYLFDIDGTLIDTTELIYKCFQKICLDYGKFDPEFDYIAGMIGLPLPTMIHDCLDDKCEFEMAIVIGDYKRFQQSIFEEYLKLFLNVNAVLGKLKENGKKIAAVTARRKESLVPYLEHTNSLQYFDLLVTPEMTKHHKPHPMPAETAIEQLNSTPDDCLFIGDSIFDMQCGQSADTDTAFVAWSHNNPDQLEKPPTYILSSMMDLLKTDQ